MPLPGKTLSTLLLASVFSTFILARSQAREFDFFAFDEKKACSDLFEGERPIEDRLFAAYEKSLAGYRNEVQTADLARTLEEALRRGRYYDFPRDQGGDYPGFIAKIGDARKAMNGHEFDARVRRHLEETLAGLQSSARRIEEITEKSTEPKVMMRDLVGHAQTVLDMRISADGKKALSSSEDGALILWNLETHSIERTLVGHSGPVRKIRVDAQFVRAISVSDDGKILQWNLATGEATEIPVFDRQIYEIEASPDLKTAITFSTDFKIGVLDLETKEMKKTISVIDLKKKQGLESIRISPDLKRVAVLRDGRRGTGIDLWNTETGKKIFSMKTPGSAIQAVHCDEGFTRAMTIGNGVPGTRTRILSGWDLTTGKLLWSKAVPDTESYGVPFRSSSAWAMTRGESALFVRDMNTGEVIRAFERKMPSPGVALVSMSEDSKKVLALYNDGMLVIWDFTRDTPIAQKYTGIRGISLMDSEIATSSSFDRAVLRIDEERRLKAFDLEWVEAPE